MDKVKVVTLKAKLELLKELKARYEKLAPNEKSDDIFKEGVEKTVKSITEDLNKYQLRYNEELIDTLTPKVSITLDLNDTGTEDSTSA